MQLPCPFRAAAAATPRLLALGLGLFLGLRLVACSAAPPASSPSAAAGDDPAAAAAEIDRAIGGARCRQDADCRVIGVGARACGGPEGYRAWSVLDTTDAAALAALVDRQAALRRAELERLGMRSTCEVLPQPGVACRIEPGAAWGRCVLVGGGGATGRHAN